MITTNSLNLAGPLRTAMLDNADLVALLGTYAGEPSIHTRRPIPSEAVSPDAVISPDVAITDADGLTSRRPIVMRDISIYGDQPDQYRQVEEAAYLTRLMFHRLPRAIVVPDYQVIQITASGPSAGPTDDATTLCRYVSLMIQLRALV